MKKSFYIAGICLMAVACEKTPEITGFSVLPETATVFTDETLPQLALTVTPEDALEGLSVEWTSSDPDIIIAGDDGQLTFAVRDIEEAEKVVTITAKAGDNTATSTITVKGQIARYGIIDLSAELGFNMLDRNVGAESASDPGLYFQWGKNEAVTAATIDTEWNAEGEGFSDWTQAGNSPCPLGWEPMNETQKDTFKAKTCDIISDYELSADFGLPSMYTDEEYEAAKALFEKCGFVPGGSIQPAHADNADENGIYNSTSVYVWTGVLNENNDGEKTAFSIEYNSSPLVTGTGKIVNAYNLRCVKSAE